MKVSGFSFIRNAVQFDYPILEAVGSILPLCDDFVLALGNSDDGTTEYLKALDPGKVRILPTHWNDTLRKGKVLAEETDKAFRAISPDTDWAFYIQGDECLHEKYLPLVRRAMEENLDDHRVEGLLFHYIHFYGSFDYYGDSRQWYRREVRILRPDPAIRSFRDAQGFRKADRKLRVKLIEAWIYHYGWVRNPQVLQRKISRFNTYYRGPDPEGSQEKTEQEFSYSNLTRLKRFEGTHPRVMQQRILSRNWDFAPEQWKLRASIRQTCLDWVEKRSGIRIGEYRNYTLIR